MKLVDRTPDVARRIYPKDVSVGSVFRYANGLPADNIYPRIYYMKVDGDRYVQLTGPSTGRVYDIRNPDLVMGVVEIVAATLTIEGVL